MKRKRLLWAIVFLFVGANVIAFLHAYTFTHFNQEVAQRTKDPEELTMLSKVGLLFTGIDNPRPVNKRKPTHDFKVIKVESSHVLECWYIKTDSSHGTMIMFHGYAGEKSSLLERAEEFIKLGYDIFLVDFSGSGGSEGNSTSIGYNEAVEVKDCFEFVKKNYPGNISLFGTSMGAAAILKSIDDYKLNPSAIILECPFGSLYKTVSSRFTMMNVPPFPMASLLCFWGGMQNGYWAFSHNPSSYAKSVTSPVLLLYGQQDERVTQEETDMIFANLQGEKVLKNYPDAGHDVFIKTNRERWVNDVRDFLSN